MMKTKKRNKIIRRITKVSHAIGVNLWDVIPSDVWGGELTKVVEKLQEKKTIGFKYPRN